MALQIRVHPGKCIATRACINRAPRTFALDGTPVAYVVKADGDSEDDVLAAADACPTGAISVFRDGIKIG